VKLKVAYAYRDLHKIDDEESRQCSDGLDAYTKVKVRGCGDTLF